MNPVIIVLSPAEWQAAEQIGLKRQSLRKARGLNGDDYKDKGGTREERNAIGAVAEYALAKHYGADILRDWCETKSFSLEHWKIKCDVGANLHVRASANPRAKMLVVHESKTQSPEEPTNRRHRRPSDPDDGIFVFATVDTASHSVTFHGWRMSGWVQKNCEWNTTTPGFNRTDRHAYTCPKDDLLPMETVPAEAIR